MVFDYFYLFVALTEDPATGEDLAATAECQVGALLFSVPMQNDAAPTWYRQISVAVPQLRRCFFMIAVDIQDSQYPEILRGYDLIITKPASITLQSAYSYAQSSHFWKTILNNVKSTAFSS
ncbi:MAG: hypothetical protein AAFX46_08400 [Cyanobacteria bacterium J06636_27]